MQSNSSVHISTLLSKFVDHMTHTAAVVPPLDADCTTRGDPFIALDGMESAADY